MASLIKIRDDNGNIINIPILQGPRGEPGKLTNITASIDNTTGIPSVAVTLGGTEEERTLDLAFSGLKGERGDGAVTSVNGKTGTVVLTASDVGALPSTTSIPAAITIDTAMSSSSTNPVQNKVINTVLENKVDKVSGKGLSTNDFTTALKNKLDGIATGATANTGTITGVTAGNGLTGGGTSGAVTLNHSNSITAGSVGAAASPTNGGTFSIPSITYDAQGHITQATTATITLPSISTSDTKVTQTVRTTNGSFPLLLRGTSAGTTTTTTTTTFGTKITANPSTGIVSATGFSGSGASLTSLNASNISSGTLAKERLATSGVTAGSYGPTGSVTSGSFNVPQVTVDTYGRVTSVTNRSVTLPSSVDSIEASKVTAGTLGGKVQANATAAATLGNAQVRDIIISTTDLTPGTSALATGTVYLVYE